jgi:hypothetical protein
MQQTSEISSSDIATKLRDPDIKAQSRDGDCQEIARTTALGGWFVSGGFDLQLAPDAPTYSRAVIGDASWHTPLNELLALLHPRLPELGDNQAVAVAAYVRTLQPALALLGALNEFRALLSQSWSPYTAYPDTVMQSQWITGNSRGQCGVSSVWLAGVLDREYSIYSTFCRGSLIFDNRQAENILDHCWLEINVGFGEALILDLTCDQARGFDREIVFDRKAALDIEHVRYISTEQVEISNLRNNPVWPRYQRLLLNMGQTS